MGLTSGEAGASVGAVILAVVGLCTAIAIMIFTSTLSAGVVQSTEPMVIGIKTHFYTVNETITIRNDSNATLAHRNVYTDEMTVRNKTYKLGSTNYTFVGNDGAYGKIKLNAGGLLGRIANGSKMNISYVYDNRTFRNNVYTSQGSALDTQRNTTQYVPLVLIAIVISIVFVMISRTDLGVGRGGNAL